MATFTVEFDHGGNILKVVDANGQTTLYKDFVPLADDPISDVRGMTITEVYMTAAGCVIHHGCRKIRVC